MCIFADDAPLEHAHLAEGDEHGVAHYHAQDAHRESCLHHVGLLDEAGRVGDGVRRGLR